MRRIRLLPALVLAAGGFAALAAEEGGKEKKPEASAAKTVLDFKVKDIDGKDVDLTKYKGHVIMVVNVASK
jgi:glutathione peroxidase